jgi:hypothetical protein
MIHLAAMFEGCVEVKLIRSSSPVAREDVLYEDDFAVTEEALWSRQGRKSLTDYWLKKKIVEKRESNKVYNLVKVERVEVISRRIGADGKRVMETEGGHKVEMTNGRMFVTGTMQFGPLTKEELKRAEENGTSKWGGTNTS